MHNLNAAGIVERARQFAGQFQRAQAPTSRRLAKPGPVMTPEDAVRRLADDMLDLRAVKDGVEETDLLNRGHTLAGLRKYGDAARDLANRAVVRRAR